MKNNTQFYIDKITETITQIFLFYLSFKAVQLVFPIIKLPFQNPQEVIGPLVVEKFNPLNNIIRLLVVIFGCPIIYYILRYLENKKKFFYVKLFACLLFTTIFFIGTIKGIYNTHLIDMFHDGQQLGPASDMLFFNKKPFSDIFFFRGFFEEPAIALMSFKLFGISFGSFFLFSKIIMRVITVFFLFLLLSIIIENKAVYILTTIFSLGSSVVRNIDRREFFTFIYLLFYVIGLRYLQKDKQKWLQFFLGLFSILVTLVSIDRGIYLSTFTILYPILSFILQNFRNDLNKRQIIQMSIKSILTTGSSLIGILLGWFLVLVIFGSRSFTAFFKMTYLEIPIFKGLFDEYIFPQFNVTKLFPEWYVVIILTIATVLLIKLLKSLIENRSLAKLDKIFLIVSFYILSLLFFRTMMGRSGISHILSISSFLFILCFLFLDYVYLLNTVNFFTGVVTFLVVGLFFTNFFVVTDILLRPQYISGDIKNFIYLPKTDDNFWLTNEQIKVRDFIIKNSTSKDYILDFTNAAAYYYLTRRKNPTRFYLVYFAATNKYQNEVLTDLKQNRPKFIIYKSADWWNAPDNLPTSYRLYKVNEWILNNYSIAKTIDSTVILSQKRDKSYGANLASFTGSSSNSYTLSSIDLINNMAFGPNNHEPIVVTSNKLYLIVEGWAINQQHNNNAVAIFISIDGRDYKTFYGKERADVAKYYNNPTYQYSGFESIIPLSDLKRGIRVVQLKILGSDSKIYLGNKVIIEVK